MNDFKILLQAVLDANSIEESDIKKIQKVIEKYHLNLTADLDKAGIISEIKKIVPELEAELKKITGVDIQINDDALIKAFNQIERQAEKTAQSINKIQHSLDTEKYSKDIKGISDELAKVGKFTLSDKTNADIFDKAQKSAESLESTYNQLKSTMVDVNATDQQKIDIENKYQQELITTKNLLSQINLSKDDEKISVGDNKRVNMIATLNSYLAKNTAMTKENKKQIEDWIAKLGSSDDMTVGAIKHINSEFKQLDATLRKTGKLGLSMWDKFKQAAEKFGGWSLVTGAITKVTSEVGKAVNELIELDNILTEISKTSDLTEQQLKKLGDTAFDTASKYGKTASDYLTGVQEMYRAGFDNAEEMAELSVLAQSAGDMDTTIANDYLLATNAAYKYKGSVEKLNKVLDSQNYITNNAAISMKDIADATTETASVAAQYGVQIDELSALIATATANTRESGSEVGTALKAIMINLQDTTSKPVTETFDALGISMTKVVNGSEQLKTPIELIYELADAYNSLPEGDIMRANILNEIGQKRHANTLASILGDIKSLDHMLELYNSNLADNSAYNEAMKSSNNLSGSLNRLSNTWTDTVENILNSETLKGGIDFLNGALTLVNKLTESLGTLGTIALGGSIFAGIKNVGKPKMYGFVKYADNYKCSLGY